MVCTAVFHEELQDAQVPFQRRMDQRDAVEDRRVSTPICEKGLDD
jgi:hypothetical protein